MPEHIGDLKKLKILKLDACKKLKTLPERIGNLENLEELDCRFCDTLTMLPESICHLKKLSRLKITRRFVEPVGKIENVGEIGFVCHEPYELSFVGSENLIKTREKLVQLKYFSE